MPLLRSLVFLALWAAPWLAFPAGAENPSPLQVVRMEPASPATLRTGDSVEVVYEYDLQAEKPFRISVTPLTYGQPTAERKLSPVQQYATAQGTDRAQLSLETAGTVDELLLLAYDAGSGQLLAKKKASVDYTFEAEAGGLGPGSILPVNEPLPSQILGDLPAYHDELSDELTQVLGGYRPPAWRLPPGQTDGQQAEDDMTLCREAGIEPRSCDDIAGRRITDDGVIVIDCADGSTWRTRTRPEKEVFTTPDGRSCRFQRMYAMSTHVAPAEVPEILGSNQELESWLREYVAETLLRQIESLVGDLDTYQSLEEGSTPQNVYQRIDHRLSFLDKLLTGPEL